jgi:hypothetical protein
MTNRSNHNRTQQQIGCQALNRGWQFLRALLYFILVVGSSSAMAAEIVSLGTGTAALVGSDRTDPENDGDPGAGALSPTWNWAGISASPVGDANFAKAFRVFDNIAEGDEGQWCCEDATAGTPRSVTVEFAVGLSLTHFSIASGNMGATSDPQDWEIKGSNDGIAFTSIFSQSNDTPLWKKRNEVLLVALDAPSPSYKFLRYECTRTAGLSHHIAEIEFFGLRPGEDADGDLIADEWERNNGLNDAINDGLWDADLDGVNNLGEFRRGSDPQVNPSPYLKAGQWNIHVVETDDRQRQLESGFGRIGAFDKLNGILITAESYHQNKRINFKERLFDLDWIFPETIEPFPNIGAYADRDDYIVEATGNIYLREAGTYTFGFNSDDGGGLWIDGNAVAIYNQNRDRGSGVDTSVGTLELTEGLHSVRLIGWENRGEAGLALFGARAKGTLTADAVTPVTVELLSVLCKRSIRTTTAWMILERDSTSEISMRMPAEIPTGIPFSTEPSSQREPARFWPIPTVMEPAMRQS